MSFSSAGSKLEVVSCSSAWSNRRLTIGGIAEKSLIEKRTSRGFFRSMKSVKTAFHVSEKLAAVVAISKRHLPPRSLCSAMTSRLLEATNAHHNVALTQPEWLRTAFKFECQSFHNIFQVSTTNCESDWGADIARPTSGQDREHCERRAGLELRHSFGYRYPPPFE